jgi:mannosyltransferase
VLRLAVAAQTALAAVLALVGIGDRAFWQDEAASVSVAARSVAGVLDVLGDTDANTGLYYLLLHAWMRLGSGEGWVRALSALFAVATVPLTALVARRLFGTPVAVVAGFVLAPNAFLLAYAQEARTYALGLFLTTLSTWLFVRAVDDPSPRILVAYAVTAALALYANLFGALVLAAQLVALGFVPRGPARALVAAQGAAAVLAAPLALRLLAGEHEQVTWIPAPGPRTLVHSAYDLAGSRPLTLVLGVLVVAGLVRLARGWAESAARRRAVLAAAWLCVPPLALFAASFATPLYVTRYVIGSLPALAIVAALGITWARARLLQVAACAVIGALSLAIWKPARVASVEDLRAAAGLVARESRPGDGIAYVPAWTRVGVDYYLRREARGPTDLALAPGGRAEQVGDLYAKEVDAATVARRLARYRRVWVASYPGSTWHPTPEPMLEAGTRVLGRRFREARSRSFGDVRIALYERRGG